MDARAQSTRADRSPGDGGDAYRASEPLALGVARRLLILGMLAVLLVSPVACGSSAAMDAEAPKQPDVAMEAKTPGEAEEAFNRAERELQQELVAFSQPGVMPAPVPTPAPAQNQGPQPPPQPGAPPSYPQGTNDDDGRAFQARQSRCTRACRALASMSRSADRLCELDGEDTDRCRNVRQRVDAARRLVTATCPSCR